MKVDCVKLDERNFVLKRSQGSTTEVKERKVRELRYRQTKRTSAATLPTCGTESGTLVSPVGTVVDSVTQWERGVNGVVWYEGNETEEGVVREGGVGLKPSRGS